MRTETVTREIYTFDELSEEAQNAAIEKQRNYTSEEFSDFYAHDVIYDAKEIGKILGIDITQIYYSGFWSQGDGACFEGSYAYVKGSAKAIRDHAPCDDELHRIARALQEAQRRYFYRIRAEVRHSGHYYHEHCTGITVYEEDVDYSHRRGCLRPEDDEIICELLRDFMRWIYRRHEAEYEHVTSEEAARDYLLNCELEFGEDGSFA